MGGEARCVGEGEAGLKWSGVSGGVRLSYERVLGLGGGEALVPGLERRDG